jgi:hypothetical protein
MDSEIKLIELLKRKYPKVLFSYNDIFFNYKCDILDSEELNLINEANEKIKDSIIKYLQETQEEINNFIENDEECHETICYKNIKEFNNSEISELYYINHIDIFPELTLNVSNYSL